MVLIVTIAGLFELLEILLKKFQIIKACNGNNWNLVLFLYASVMILITFFIQIHCSALMRITMVKTKRTEIFTKVIYFSLKLSIVILLISMIITVSFLVIIYKMKISRFEYFLALVFLNNIFIQIIICILNVLINIMNNFSLVFTSSR
jgi:hypothetical protein